MRVRRDRNGNYYIRVGIGVIAGNIGKLYIGAI